MANSTSVSRAVFLSHFTPTLMTPEALEAILVERDELANELVERVLTSIESGTKSQTLLIGPRGIGKTHLVALTYYRVKARLKEIPELNDKVCIAWLREDEYGVVSWLDLLIRLFRALEEEHPGTTPRAEIDALFAMSTNDAERQAEKLLLSYLNGRTLWLLVENLNAIFEDMKESGQRKWRAFWQEHPVFTTLATSPTLFKGVSSRTAPFYGFFAIEPLTPLDTEGATHLLSRIAHFRGDDELADFLETSTGRARVRAVHHLAGGNFRVYVVFSAFLSRQSLDELVPPVLQLLDELTPYYQSHLMLLSGQQRKIVEVLCDYRGAIPVKDLSIRGFMTSQTASSQLADLKDRGYVVAHTWGRESFYELREPLMRLCLEVKKHRGEPIAIFVEFLRLWHSRAELRGRLEVCPPDFPFERESLTQALAKAEMEAVEPHISATLTDLERAMEVEEYEKALSLARDMIEIRGDAWDWACLGECLFRIGDEEGALNAYSQAIELNPEVSDFWYSRAAVRLTIPDRREEAVSDATKALSLENSPTNLFGLGTILTAMKRYSEALSLLNQTLKSQPHHPGALFYKGIVQSRLGRYSAALQTWRKLEKMGEQEPDVWREIARVLIQLDKWEEAFPYYVKLVAAFPEDTLLWAMFSGVAIVTQRFSVALRATERAIELGDDSTRIRLEHALALVALGHWHDGLTELKEILSIASTKVENFDGYSPWLVKSLFASFKNGIYGEDLAAQLHILCTLYEEVVPKGVLGAALIVQTDDLVKGCTSERESSIQSQVAIPSFAPIAFKWVEVWLSASASFPLVNKAVKWTEVAVQVASSGNEKLLLNLPSEERQIVRGMLEEGSNLSSNRNGGGTYAIKKRVRTTTKMTKLKSSGVKEIIS